ncbi:MAG: DUF433 domain-containing protein [Phenylobacterium sp.]|uniref:DUF433 domain-containing protein n=1 Tax=Phenylobacterium sp. TaxID=1871053 RepID=UPI0027341B52|nr:DUF433 domain-containing protein [Phenylobacterium sp.]MDP3749700.1 DUF433 domain-containing protein [Phenylobacterium sp.]
MKLTTSEAGFVLNKSATSVNRAIDRGEIQGRLAEVAQVKVALTGEKKVLAKVGRKLRAKGRPTARLARVVGAAEMRYLMLLGLGHAEDLTPGGRRTIYRAIKGAGAERTVRWKATYLQLDPIDEALQARLKRLEELKAAVDISSNGDPVLRGPNISVYRVAALSKGESIEEVLLDYPGVTRHQVAIAIDYATAYPKPGRPYPTRSLKRMAGDLADAGVFDVEPEEPVTPDDFR